MLKDSLTQQITEGKIKAILMPAEKIDHSVIAISFMNEAIAYCAEKLGVRGKKEVMLFLQENDAFAHRYLRYSLAKQIAEYLAEVENTLKSVYYFEELDEPVHLNLLSLMVQIERKTAAFDSLCEGLNQNLIKEYKKLMAPKAHQLKHFLNILVDDSETGVKSGTNYLFNPPIKIWNK
jgi:hypothetical protein